MGQSVLKPPHGSGYGEQALSPRALAQAGWSDRSEGMESTHFVKALAALTALPLAGWPAYAAEPGSLLGQPVPTQAMPASASGLPALQGNAGQPPDSSPFTPDGPEKLARVKKLLKQITSTYGLRTGREFGSTSWGPRLGKLYELSKQLTDNDWKLLAEMYFTFYNSDCSSLAGVQVNFNDKDVSRLDDGMTTLLAMHGEMSIEMLNAMMVATQTAKTSSGNVNMIKGITDFKPWRNLSEYKKDQQQIRK